MAFRSLKLVEERQGVAKQGAKYIAPKCTVAELWKDAERSMHSLHFVQTYHASFRPEVAHYLIKKFSRKGELVVDPFCGSGTTALEACLSGRYSFSSDINPLALKISRAKLNPVGLDEIVLGVNQLNGHKPVDMSDFQSGLFPFFSVETYRELMHLRTFAGESQSRVAAFMELLTLSRLHGHTSAYLSAYTAPQKALSPEKQQVLNARRREAPTYRALAPRLIRRAAEVLQDGFTSEFYEASRKSSVELSDSRRLGHLATNSADLVIAGPPMPEDYSYPKEHWLSYWLIGEKTRRESFYSGESLEKWSGFMRESLTEMLRVARPSAVIALVLSELRTDSSRVFLDDLLAELVPSIKFAEKRLEIEELLINQQKGKPQTDKSANVSWANDRILVLRVKSRPRSR